MEKPTKIIYYSGKYSCRGFDDLVDIIESEPGHYGKNYTIRCSDLRKLRKQFISDYPEEEAKYNLVFARGDR